MHVQFSNTPYAQLTRPGPDEALRRARAALDEMTAKGTVRTSSMGLRLGKLGVRYSSTSVRIDGQARQPEPLTSGNTEASGDFEAAAQIASAASAQTATDTSDLGVPSLFARARRRMAEALLGNTREFDDAEASLDNLLRSRRGAAMYSEALHAAPQSGCILACTV